LAHSLKHKFYKSVSKDLAHKSATNHEAQQEKTQCIESEPNGCERVLHPTPSMTNVMTISTSALP